ncbi:hypothetical protein [Longimycelium tulufanense]|uniref:hypothetical protein n=1 Tax=Longimycelium tulufanense TaxID=907463 RepID=UPI00166602FB|nr:hypothetical protein [Longimycelium tulufanense]
MVVGISVLVVVALGLLVGAFFLGRATAPGAGSGSGSGDVTLRDGMPVPNRHSVAGAATAASNYQIACTRVSAGTLDPEQAGSVLLSDSASDTAKQGLQKPTAPADALSQERKSFAPASIVVESYTADRAVVRVWGAWTSSSRIVPDPAGSAMWGNTVITLDWQRGQWRVSDQRFQEGPWPARSGQRFAKSEGEFAFRYDEVRGGAWAYVPEG